MMRPGLARRWRLPLLCMLCPPRPPPPADAACGPPPAPRAQEAERLHQLRHPAIVSLFGICLAGSSGLLITEYCAGRDLRSALQIKKAGTGTRLFGW